MSRITVTQKSISEPEVKAARNSRAANPNIPNIRAARPRSAGLPADGLGHPVRPSFVREGAVADYAEIARLGHVTRARLTQIVNLLHLAPDIQETLLLLPPVEKGRDPITERELRPIAAEPDWKRQRRMWRRIARRSD